MKYCTNCGNELSENSEVCTKCGKFVNEEKKNFNNNSNKKNKTWVIPLVVILSIFFIVGVFGGDSDSESDELQNNSSDDVSVNADNDDIGSVTNDDNKDNTDSDKNSNNTIGNYVVYINDYEITYNYSGKPIILISFSFTNNDDEEQAFGYVLDAKAYQNDIEIKETFSTYGIDNLDWEDEIRYIKPGATFTFNIGYELNDTTSDVTVEVTTFWSSKYSKKVSKKFVIG